MMKFNWKNSRGLGRPKTCFLKRNNEGKLGLLAIETEYRGMHLKNRNRQNNRIKKWIQNKQMDPHICRHLGLLRVKAEA